MDNICILNLNQEDFFKNIDDETLVICINNKNNEINKPNYINMRNIFCVNIKKYKQIVFYIVLDNENLHSTIKLIRKIKLCAFICKLYKKKLGYKTENKVIIANIQKLNISENLYFSIESALYAITIENKKERNKYVYKKSCQYLDKEIVEKNVCGFYNDKCSAKKDSNVTMGCCHHYPHKRTGIFRNEKLQLCEYQVGKKCIANCLTCKMYMCDEMRKKGYKYNVFNVPLINCFFNLYQKLILSVSFFTTEEEIIKKL